MNKLFPAAMLGVALLFTACDKNDGPESTVKFMVPSYTLATDQTTGAFKVYTATFETEFDQVNGLAEIEADRIALPGDRTISFDADDMPYSIASFTSGYGNTNAYSIVSQYPPLDQDRKSVV